MSTSKSKQTARKEEGIDTKLLLSGLAGISPIPIIGEIGMYLFLDRVLEQSPFQGISRKGIAAATSILTRLYGIYPLYSMEVFS